MAFIISSMSNMIIGVTMDYKRVLTGKKDRISDVMIARAIWSTV